MQCWNNNSTFLHTFFRNDSSSILFSFIFKLNYSEVPTDDTAVRFLIFFLDDDDGSLNFISRLGIVSYLMHISNSERRSIQMIPSGFSDWTIHTKYISLLAEKTKMTGDDDDDEIIF